ncbi:ATP-binding cassette domain-containing protein [Marinomonas ostreistagni]|uniref:ATP-binding cassette domain-containing protein n=1 Tax=Marinomonas ostreistagni TaxID=359209 RepID=A0ABS0Z6F1_9GAMM|nr:ATP-binding cassette domain-containing protein [Marinomonas ostreistagni]MBJ7549217.1 ATP-binding cassette domain-containing protein [Marinomonas ostreistagni]
MLSFDVQYQWQNFEAHYQGQFAVGATSILGASGCGKSTLLSLLGGYVVGQGSIGFSGQDLSLSPPFERPITTLFQSDNLFPQLSVWDNVAIGICASRSLSSAQKEKVTWALEQVQLSDCHTKYPDQLSGGQAQRVAIARVLVRDKPILLLDEPFSALDPKLRSDMLVLIKTLTETYQWTTVMVTHSPADAVLLGGNVLLVEAGKIVAQTDAKKLYELPSESPFCDYLSVS